MEDKDTVWDTASGRHLPACTHSHRSLTNVSVANIPGGALTRQLNKLAVAAAPRPAKAAMVSATPTQQGQT
jgi:hypothetical protein